MGFSRVQVEVRGYIDAAKTIMVRYIVVNALFSYNLLLGRPSINKLGVVISTIHLKMKFLTDEGKVVTMRVNQETTQKCYEDRLKT